MSAGERVQRQRWWWWALMGVAAVALLMGAARTTPTSGVSDERLFQIAGQLKCQQCVSESVAGSQSPSAVKFREEISSLMAQGRTDDEILNHFVRNFGPEVLLTPPSSGIGGLVWVLPVVVAAGAGLLLAGTFRRWRADAPARHVTAEDLERVAAARRSRNDRPT